MEAKKHRISLIEIATCVVLIATYILPTGLLATQYQISKYFFTFSVFAIFVVSCIHSKRMNLREIILIIYLIVAALVTRNMNFLVFITLPYANIMIQYKDKIIKYLIKSNIMYICVGFTLLYSISCYLFLPKPLNEDHVRLVRTAVIEINQSGLSIFCLGVLLRCKNKKLSNIVLLSGVLTESRSYFLALLVYGFSKLKISRKIINKINVKYWSYMRLTVIAEIMLYGLGIVFIFLYHNGLIIPFSSEDKTFALNDYSNFFRFSLIVLLCYSITKKPSYLLCGLSDEEYWRQLGHAASGVYHIPYGGNKPHNLFFSHLQKYGLFSIIETYYVSIVLSRVVTKKNFYVLIALFLYSILLGAGMYSYWLYLSMFTLIVDEWDNSNVIEQSCLY